MDWRELSDLEWGQPSAFSRSYELRQGDRLIETLEFDSAFGSRAAARADEGRWTFKRTGFFSPKVTARAEGAENEVALYEPGWTGAKGTLILSGGERLHFKASNFWNTEWTLAQEGGGPLLQMHSRGVIHHGAAVEIAEAGRQRGDLALLVPLCWYILLLYMSDAAAAAMAAG